MFFATAFREWDDPGVAFATSGTWYARSGEAQGARLRGLRFDNHLPTTHLPHKHLIRNHPHARERERLRHIQARGVRLRCRGRGGELGRVVAAAGDGGDGWEEGVDGCPGHDTGGRH